MERTKAEVLNDKIIRMAAFLNKEVMGRITNLEMWISIFERILDKKGIASEAEIKEVFEEMKKEFSSKIEEEDKKTLEESLVKYGNIYFNINTKTKTCRKCKKTYQFALGYKTEEDAIKAEKDNICPLCKYDGKEEQQIVKEGDKVSVQDPITGKDKEAGIVVLPPKE
jgi:Zn finger protein HypA/HybF involved in hydrogenase expression